MKCPVCASEMSKHSSFEVETDLCKAHGMWLDKGELAKIIESFAEQERASRAAGEDNRQQGRYEGIFLGWLSLFLPK